MATNEVSDAQFEELILHTLRTMPNGTINIIKKNNRIMQVNIEEDLRAARSRTINRESNLTVVPGRQSG